MSTFSPRKIRLRKHPWKHISRTECALSTYSWFGILEVFCRVCNRSFWRTSSPRMNSIWNAESEAKREPCALNIIYAHQWAMYAKSSIFTLSILTHVVLVIAVICLKLSTQNPSSSSHKPPQPEKASFFTCPPECRIKSSEMVVHGLECFYLLENFRPDATGEKKQNKASRYRPCAVNEWVLRYLRFIASLGGFSIKNYVCVLFYYYVLFTICS
jgi:hypothetical protein